MSQKINAKNLSYDTSLPPFLAALRAQAGPGHQAPTIGQRQLGKKRSDSEEAEDAPLVLDDDGNVVSVDVGVDGSVVRRETETEDADEESETVSKKDGGVDTSTKSSAAIGTRKRKVGKVIGGDAVDDTTKGDGPTKVKKQEKEDMPKEKKAKKKAKKIKLSFDEEDG